MTRNSSHGDREALESELSFMLRSLDDLDVERSEEAIDDDTFSTLHADYTARAASLTRRLAGEADHIVVAERQQPRWMLTLVALGLVLLTVSLGAIMFAAPRGDGGLTGKDLSPTTTTIDMQATADALTAAVEADPEDFDARLDLGLFLFQARDYVAASEQLVNAVRIDPRSVEAQSYYGWALWQVAQLAPEGDGRTDLVDLSVEHLTSAIELGPDDASANTFLGVVLYRGRGDADLAIPYLERALDLAGSQAPPMLTEVIEEARATVRAQTTTEP